MSKNRFTFQELSKKQQELEGAVGTGQTDEAALMDSLSRHRGEGFTKADSGTLFRILETLERTEAIARQTAETLERIAPILNHLASPYPPG